MKACSNLNLFVATAAAVSFGFAACGGGNAETPPPQSPPSDPTSPPSDPEPATPAVMVKAPPEQAGHIVDEKAKTAIEFHASPRNRYVMLIIS